jgi:hypothetical protein
LQKRPSQGLGPTGLTAAAGEDQESNDDDPNDVVVKKVAKTVVHTYLQR